MLVVLMLDVVEHRCWFVFVGSSQLHKCWLELVALMVGVMVVVDVVVVVVVREVIVVCFACGVVVREMSGFELRCVLVRREFVLSVGLLLVRFVLSKGEVAVCESRRQSRSVRQVMWSIGVDVHRPCSV